MRSRHALKENHEGFQKKVGGVGSSHNSEKGVIPINLRALEVKLQAYPK